MIGKANENNLIWIDLEGSEVARACLTHGHEIVAICRSNRSGEKAKLLGCTVLPGDITKPETYGGALKNVDIVIDAVGTGLPKRITRRKARTMGESQLRFTRGLISACSAARVEKLLLTVGSHLFVPADPNDWAVETNPPLFKGFARTVADVWTEYDKLCSESGIVIRCHPGFVYGPGSWFRNQLVLSIKRWGKPQMIGDGQNYCPYVCAEDVGEGYRLAAEEGQPNEDYIFAAAPARQIDFVNLTSRLLGGKEIRSGLPLWLSRIIVGEVLTEAMTISVRASSKKAKQELGWLPKYPTVDALKID